MKLVMNQAECVADFEAHGYEEAAEMARAGEAWTCSVCYKDCSCDIPHVHLTKALRIDGLCSEGCAIKAREEVYAG